MTEQDPNQMSAGATRAEPQAPLGYVVGWMVAGAATVATVLVLNPRWPTRTALLLLVVMVIAELAEVEFSVGRLTTSFTLLEAGVSASLFLVEPSTALLVTITGLTVGQAVRRREALKIAFNVAQVAVATGAALLLVHGWGERVVADEPIAMVIVGVAMLAYALVTLVATSGLLARVTGHPARGYAGEHGPHLVLTILGNSALGFLGAVVALRYPHLLPLIAAPAIAMYLSSRGAIRTRALLAQLRAEHERLDRVVSEASDGIVLLDGNGIIEVWSRSMGRIAGIDANMAIGRAVEDLPFAVQDDRVVLAIPDGEAVEIDGIFHHADGSRKAVQASHSLMRDDAGLVVADVVVIRDVTRQREVEAMKGNFVARVSHELRTPLTPIKGMAEVLLKGRGRIPPERQEVALQQIVDRATHLARIVEDLLLVSKDTQGDDDPSADMDLKQIGLGPVVEQAVTWFRAEHPERELTLSIESPLPEVHADPLRLTQILTNLLSNAAKYSDRGQPVEVDVVHRSTTLMVDVHDRGEGIPADKRDEIFAAFQRLEDPMTMRTGGIGLGLYLARRFARAMDGELSVCGRSGGGSTFRLVLPAFPDATYGAAGQPLGGEAGDASGDQSVDPTGKAMDGPPTA